MLSNLTTTRSGIGPTKQTTFDNKGLSCKILISSGQVTCLDETNIPGDFTRVEDLTALPGQSCCDPFEGRCARKSERCGKDKPCLDSSASSPCAPRWTFKQGRNSDGKDLPVLLKARRLRRLTQDCAKPR